VRPAFGATRREAGAASLCRRHDSARCARCQSHRAFPARSYSGESPLGDLIADAMREFASSDFAFMNSGGIRSDLKAGELVYADIFAISPFDNFPAVVTMTGAQVLETLRLTTSGARGIMQVSGLKYTVDAAKDAEKPVAERNRIVSVTLPDGSALDPEKLYTVAMPDFIAMGGDGTQTVMQTVPRERLKISYIKPIRDVLVEVLSRRPQPIAPSVEGRITVLGLPRD
jgi:5'-nucleotidase